MTGASRDAVIALALFAWCSGAAAAAWSLVQLRARRYDLSILCSVTGIGLTIVALLALANLRRS